MRLVLRDPLVVYRGYVSVHNLNEIESVICGDVPDVQELLEKDKREVDAAKRETQEHSANNVTTKNIGSSQESQNSQHSASQMTSQGSNDARIRKSTRVTKVSKRLFESNDSAKTNMDQAVEQENENNENVSEKTVEVSERVRKDLKILRRLDHCVEHLHRHIERIGEPGAVGKCEFLVQSMMMLSLNEKMK